MDDKWGETSQDKTLHSFLYQESSGSATVT